MSDEEEDEQDEEENEQFVNRRATVSISSSTDDPTNSDDDEDDSDYESVPWSEGSENENEPGCDLFVACAWNGVTYLIDWNKRYDDEQDSIDSEQEEQVNEKQPKIKYQLVKFAFEGRVCAFYSWVVLCRKSNQCTMLILCGFRRSNLCLL